jgi:hypothetical protein
MAFKFITPRLGAQAIAETSPTQKHFIGEIQQAVDDTYGAGEFIYLKGLAATAIGNLVIYDQFANTTVRTVAGSRGPAAVAMWANVANQFGWYQIAGAAVVTSGTVAAAGAVYLTATAGLIDDAVVSTDKVDGARIKTADGTPSAGFAVVQINRPAANGNG